LKFTFTIRNSHIGMLCHERLKHSYRRACVQSRFTQYFCCYSSTLGMRRTRLSYAY